MKFNINDYDNSEEFAPQQPSRDEWSDPQPIPNDLRPVDPFDTDFLPDAIAPWVVDISERLQCPPDFVGVPAVVALGSTIGRRVAISPQANTDWAEVPNLWTCIIGRPGLLKSPALSQVMKPLKRLEAQAREKFSDDMDLFKKEEVLHAIQKDLEANRAKAAMKEGKSTDGILTTNELTPPVAKRFVTNDTTYEKLGEILSENPSGVLVERDEIISLLRPLDREENAAARGLYLQAWNGTGGYTFDRIVRGSTHVDAVCISMLGGTQPGRITDYIRRASSGAGDDGLVQRFNMLVWPDISPVWRDVDVAINAAARDAAYGVFERLAGLDPMDVGATIDPYGDVPFLRFDPDALDAFRDWRGVLERRLRSGELHPALESHLAKYRKLVPALSLINHLADGEFGPVGLIALKRATAMAEYLETHAQRAYAAGLDKETTPAKAIAKRIRKGDIASGFSTRDILRKGWSDLADKESVHGGVELLVDLGWLRAERTDTNGRPSTRYSVNPRVSQ